MERLTHAERELVALGAALASNCVPCIEHHVPQARAAGLSDEQINEAIRMADAIRQVPARKVLAAARALLDPGVAGEELAGAGAACGGAPAPGESPCCG